MTSPQTWLTDISGGVPIQNLAYDKQDLTLTQEMTPHPLVPVGLVPLPEVTSKVFINQGPLRQPKPSPGYTPWLLSGMLLVEARTDFTTVSVRNISEINQILTKGKCWEKIGGCPIKEENLMKNFPLYLGKIKIKLRKKQILVDAGLIYHLGRHLPHPPAPSASLPAPSQLPAGLLPTLCSPAKPPLPARQPGPCQLPACPPSRQCACRQPTRLLPGPQSAARHPPGSQGQSCSQSEVTIICSQSEKSLVVGEKLLINPCPSEEGQIQGSDSTNYSDSPEDEKNQVSKIKNNSTPRQWDSGDQIK
ncbi:hypothetical protein DSO57_1020982 [Entomophthora muscae]|uniref:Uncharacterized protein n=1 Tax=Entomophthora muscae TaxID=34485 RepID=A0ACC2UPZ9_9FUNG|nr:hypothetical protein DSO57_1020982 [Entomophthora muscae]